MSIYWSETLKGIEPYVPGEQPGDKKYIKLNTNENPYPPSPRVIEKIREAADGRIRLYPDPEFEELRNTLAEYHNLDKSQVYAGNGSDELLAFSFLAFFNPGGPPVLFPDITYSFYPVYSNLFRINCRPIPLDESFNIPEEQFRVENGGIIFPNPNAPTGKYLPVELIDKILRQNRQSVVIVDEAYIDFGGESAARYIGEHPNLLIVRTLSKSHSLAGMRVGYVLGHKELIEGMARIKNSVNSYTLDRIALAAAVEAIKDTAYFQETRRKIINTRERVSAKLKEMGFNVVDSKANFVFAAHPLVPACDIFRKLREEGILVRHFNKPRIDNYLRVSIGTDEEMDCFLKEAGRIVGI